MDSSLTPKGARASQPFLLRAARFSISSGCLDFPSRRFPFGTLKPRPSRGFFHSRRHL
jgi:hypothetical protein